MCFADPRAGAISRRNAERSRFLRAFSSRNGVRRGGQGREDRSPSAHGPLARRLAAACRPAAARSTAISACRALTGHDPGRRRASFLRSSQALHGPLLPEAPKKALSSRPAPNHAPCRTTIGCGDVGCSCLCCVAGSSPRSCWSRCAGERTSAERQGPALLTRSPPNGAKLSAVLGMKRHLPPYLTATPPSIAPLRGTDSSGPPIPVSREHHPACNVLHVLPPASRGLRDGARRG